MPLCTYGNELGEIEMTRVKQDAKTKLRARAGGVLVAKPPAHTLTTNEEYLRVEEFAQRANIKTKTARNWVAMAKVSSVRLSAKAIRIPLSELNRLIEEGTRLAKEQSA
jgi:hypothetical protein